MRTTNGLTVIEVVIALGILAVGVLAAAGLQASALRSSSVAEELQRLNAEARSLLEARRGMAMVVSPRAPTSCTQEAFECFVEVLPCAATSSELACDIGNVFDPTAYAVTVEVVGERREVTLRTVVLR